MKKMVVCCLLASFVWCSASAQIAGKNIQFTPSYSSFKQYNVPDWFRNAKFGIWSHWGPQAVPRQGDWYARKMYMNYYYDNKTKQYVYKPDWIYTYHLKHYGHPSTFGYKDIIPLWKAERWDPEKLMKLYKKAGAKYFVSMGTHHDHFFLWDSKIHKWNSVNMGPKKDVVALWQKAAKKQGLYFGVSEHLAASYTWFQPSHGFDREGNFKDVPFDGANPEFQDLYHAKADSTDNGWLTKNPAFQKDWLKKINELVDMYKPDLLYSDSKLPFDSFGKQMLANFYNSNYKAHKGKMTAVYNCKENSDGMWVRDIERGANDSISLFPWQTDTSIGDWFYKEGQQYFTAAQIVQMLVDIVSKNGNLLINIVQNPEGDIEKNVEATLEEIGAWTAINGDGIYDTRPWKIFGEGPSTIKKQEKGHFGGVKDVRAYENTDIRFTTKKDNIYAFLMGKPTKNIQIFALKAGGLETRSIQSIELLGSKEKIQWKQDNAALIIELPNQFPATADKAVCFKIRLKK